MRLLMTTDTVGGVWNYAATLCSELSGAGVEVGLATMGGALNEAQQEQAAAIPGLRVFEDPAGRRLEWMDDPWEDVERTQSWLQDVVQQFQPDVFQANAYAPALLELPCPTLLVAHSCVCTWWRAVKGEAAPARYNRYRRVAGAALARAGRVVAPTRAFASELQREYGLQIAPTVVRNGICGPRTAAAADRSYPIVTVGRLWDEAKNVSAVLEAARGLDAQVAAIGARSAGSGAGGATADLPDNVSLLGVLSPAEVHAQLRAARVYAAPARYEPFGLAILEAAQEFCALVLGDIPTLRELWGGAAIFVPPDDPEALRTALADLMLLPGRAATLGARAHVRARRYSARRMGRSYLELYRQLASVDLAAAG